MSYIFNSRILVMAASVWVTTGAVAACSSDKGTGAGGGELRDAATGGGSTGGSSGGSKASGGTGGAGSAGRSSTGGAGTGGAPGGGRSSVEPDADVGCVAPRYLVYRAAGCSDIVKPECIAPPADGADGGLYPACGCDGKTELGGDGFLRPYGYLGECHDGGVSDSGTDARSD
jgi:hypothetical protein